MESRKGEKGGGLHPNDPSGDESDRSQDDLRSLPLEKQDHKRKKKMEPQPSTSKQAMKRKLEDEDDSEEEVQPGPSRKIKKRQTSLIEFKCKVDGCRHVARNVYGATIHQELHEKGYLLRCVICDHLFAERKQASHHVLYEHGSKEYGRFLAGPPGTEIAKPNADGFYGCEKCPYTSRQYMQINHHNEAHQKGFQFICDICHNLFPTKQILQTHKAHQHPESKSDTCTVPGCNYKFPNHQSRTHHMKVHAAGWDYRCTLCHAIFGCKGRGSAADHCRKLHEGHCPTEIMEVKEGIEPLKPDSTPKRKMKIKDLRCDECSFQTTSDQALIGHRGRHEKGFQFACNVCHQLFKTEKEQLIHLKKEHDVNLECKEDGCQFTTTEFNRYQNHQNAHEHGVVRKCGLCHDVFAAPNTAYEHVKSQHPGSSTAILQIPSNVANLRKDRGAVHKYKCHLCNKTFPSTHSIIRHYRRTHKKDWKEIIGFKLERIKPVFPLDENVKCPYEKKFLGEGKQQSRYCLYASKNLSVITSHNKHFHETELSNEPPARPRRSKLVEAHFGHLVEKCTIDGCNFETYDKRVMRKHVCGHGAGFEFKCNFCDHVFATCGDARIHVAFRHTRKIDLTAISLMPREEVLDYMFKARKQHKKNEMLRHNKYRTICMQTHMDILRKKMLRRELQDKLYSTIVIETVYTCPSCPVKTDTFREMKAHRKEGCSKKKFESKIAKGIRAGTEKKFGCQYLECKFQTDSAVVYYKHLQKHSIHIPVVCKICFDIFKTLRQCTQHSMVAHTTAAKGKRTALIFREPLEDLVCTVCKPREEFYHSTCFLLHTESQHNEIHEIEQSRIMTTYDKDEFHDRRPPLPLREVDLDKKTSLLPSCMQKELKPLEFEENVPCEYCDEMFYHPTCVDLHKTMKHKDKLVQEMDSSSVL